MTYYWAAFVLVLEMGTNKSLRKEPTMDDVWFTEELIPAEATVEQAVKSVMDVTKSSGKWVNHQIKSTARVLYAWIDHVGANWIPPRSSHQAGSHFFLVRLGFQFEVPQESR